MIGQVEMVALYTFHEPSLDPVPATRGEQIAAMPLREIGERFTCLPSVAERRAFMGAARPVTQITPPRRTP